MRGAIRTIRTPCYATSIFSSNPRILASRNPPGVGVWGYGYPQYSQLADGPTILLQLRVLGLGLLQDGNVGVGVFPEGEKILVGSAGFVGVAL
jgi:hypothetical protein